MSTIILISLVTDQSFRSCRAAWLWRTWLTPLVGRLPQKLGVVGVAEQPVVLLILLGKLERLQLQTHTKTHVRALSRVHAHICTLAAHLTRSPKPRPLSPLGNQARERNIDITGVMGQSQQRSRDDILSEV